MMDMLTAARIKPHLAVTCPRLECFEEIDSTNSYLKREAVNGAPHGSVAVANSQSAGRGRMGRQFQSPPGKGLYLSVLLRPKVTGEALLRVTGMAAVAACRAVQSASGAEPGIKWTNDLVLNGRKLAGILAETVMLGEETALILGVGINVHHRREDFDGEVADLATSLAQEGFSTSRSELAAALVGEFYSLSAALDNGTGAYTQEYRERCVTLGKEVRLLWSDTQERITALDIDDAFGLQVRLADGTVTTVRSGEVSVRGLYGYVE